MGRSSVASSTCEVKGLLSGPRMKVWQWPYFQGTFILNYSKCSETKLLNKSHSYLRKIMRFIYKIMKDSWFLERNNSQTDKQNFCLNKISVRTEYLFEQTGVISDCYMYMCYWVLIQIFVPSAVPVVYWETRSCTT